MMVPVTQYAVIKAISKCLPSHAKAIDPFMGSGTALMSCLEFGFNVFGQDINPFAVLLAKAKIEKYDIHELHDACNKVLDRVRRDIKDSVDVTFKNIDKWFNHDVQIDLSKIRRAIRAEKNQVIRNLLWIMMSEVIRIGSNDRTSTFKLHRRTEMDIMHRKVDVIKEFEILLKRSIGDIGTYQDKLLRNVTAQGKSIHRNATISWGDTKRMVVSGRGKFDLLVSSPPYGDNHTTVTYGQTSYLPLQWIDSADLCCPYDYLKTTREIDSKSLGGIIRRKDVVDLATTVFERSETLRKFFDSIPSEEQPKYYKTLSFMSDFDMCLGNIVPKMKKGAFYIWTIGNRFVGNREIPNNEILIDLMASRGVTLFEKAERQIYNKKQPKRNNFSRTMEKEHVLIFH